MNTTEEKYWVNGFDRRGSFWSYAFSIGHFAVLICRPGCNNPVFSFYWLTS